MNDNKFTRLNNLQMEIYDETRVDLMVVDPYKLHVYRVININDFPDLKRQLPDKTRNNKYILRVYEVSNIIFNGNNAHYYFDIDVDEERGNCYIDLWSAGGTYCVEVGIRVKGNRFLPLVLSNIVSTSKVSPAEFSEPEWMNVEMTQDNTGLRLSELKITDRIESEPVCSIVNDSNIAENNETRKTCLIDNKLNLEKTKQVIETAKNWDQIEGGLNDTERKYFTKNINKLLNNSNHNSGFQVPLEILKNRNVLTFSSMS